MNAATAMFSLKTTIHERPHFARRSTGTKGKTVCIVWNAYARNASLFTDEERRVLMMRYSDVVATCVGAVGNANKIIDEQERKAS